jgi:hypothetical protein
MRSLRSLLLPSRLGAVLASLGLLAASPAFAATEYHWVGAATAEFGTPTNWNPVRTTPAADDRLVFDGGGDYTVMNPTTATIGQFIVENPTRLVISANTGFGGRQISIAGGPGPDFELEPGSSIRIAGDKPISFVIRNGATAVVSGWYMIDTNPEFQMFNQFIAEAPEAIQFMAGSIFELKEGMFTSPFNNSITPDVPNMARFRANSVYVHGCGQAPPLDVVVFDPDSRYVHADESPPTIFAGRTFGDFEYRSPLVQTISGNGNFSVGDLMVTEGRLNLAVVGDGVVSQVIGIQPGAYLRLGPSSGTLNLRLAGVGQQIVQNPNNGAGGAGLTIAPGLRLIVDNPWGVRLDNEVPLDFAGVLEFRQGIVTTSYPQGNNHVRLRYGTGSTTGASASTGWFNGYMLADITPGNPTVTFPFGTETSFAPYTLTVHGLSDTARVGGAFEDSLPPSWFEGSQLHPVKRLEGKDFYVTVQRDTGYSSFDATFQFQPPGGADPLQFVARVRGLFGLYPEWRPTTRGAVTPTSLQVTGVTRRPGERHFYFALGEPSQVHVSVLDGAVAEGAGGGARTPSTQGAATVPFRVVLSEPAVEPVQVDYAVAGGSAEAGVDFTPTSGTLVFPPGDTALVVDVPVLGDGTAEPHETLTLALTNATNAVIDRAEGTGEILDDDDVTPPVASVVYPNGGETLIEGSTVDLQWTASDNVTVAALKLFYSPNGGTSWLPIATDVPNTGSFSWQVPTGLTQNALFRVRAYDHRGQVATDESDASWWIWNVDGVEPVVPARFAFDLASANPTVGAMRFRLALTRDQAVRMLVHDVRGRLVEVPVDERRPAGAHTLEWSGRGVRAGVYFVSMESEEGSAVRRVVRLR